MVQEISLDSSYKLSFFYLSPSMLSHCYSNTYKKDLRYTVSPMLHVFLKSQIYSLQIQLSVLSGNKHGRNSLWEGSLQATKDAICTLDEYASMINLLPRKQQPNENFGRWFTYTVYGSIFKRFVRNNLIKKPD